MPTVVLVRHGKPAAAFGAALDPGLDATGRRQAEAAALRFEARGPVPIVSSPLARARETAEPLAQRWACVPRIEERVAELPSPTSDLEARARYVQDVLADTWSGVDAPLRAWRAALIDCVQRFESDCFVFSHFIAINALVGAATGDERVLVFRPTHASATTLSVSAEGIAVESLGREAETEVR